MQKQFITSFIEFLTPLDFFSEMHPHLHIFIHKFAKYSGSTVFCYTKSYGKKICCSDYEIINLHGTNDYNIKSSPSGNCKIQFDPFD